MAVIDIKTFGGILPSVQPRKLPDESAQTAHNLDLRYGDFRPLRAPGDIETTVEAGAKSLFRTPSGEWLSSVNDVNYVNAQINDAESERVYLTGRSAFPEAYESGVYRRLGVPQPTVAPGVTLMAGDEFSDAEGDAFRKEFIDTVAAAAAETDVLLGNAPPSGGPVDASDDPEYSKVELHVRFNANATNTVVDSSFRRRAMRTGSGFTLSGTTDGPLGVAGGQYGIFDGNASTIEVTNEVRLARERPWTVRFFTTSDTGIKTIRVRQRGNVIREFRGEGPGEQMIFSQYRRPDHLSTALTVSNPSGPVLVAGVPAEIVVVNTDKVRVYVDGVLRGESSVSFGIAVSGIGSGTNNGFQTYQGRIDEFQVTSDARVTAPYTPVYEPYPGVSPLEGFWIEHGAVGAPANLPTTEAGDAAFLVDMDLVDGAYVITDPRAVYLQQAALTGVQVSYESRVYWAVPFKFQAQGKDVDEAAVLAALLAIEDPANPPDLLLDAGQAAEIANAVEALYDPTLSPALGLVGQVNLIQNAVVARLASDITQGAFEQTETQRAAAASALQSLRDQLRSACLFTKEYYDSLSPTAVRAVLSDSYTAVVFPLLPEAITRIIGTRAYVYTYVTDWGEESAPSPPSVLLDADQNDTVALTITAPPSGRNVVGWRLYRSSTTNVGAAFQLVEDKLATNAVLDGVFFDYFDITEALAYTDAKKQEELQESLQTLTWIEPPTNLIGLVGMPNGIMAGFFGKTLCFSEPFAPYAWPLEYQLTLEYDIVGLGVFGQTLVVLTEGNPYYASGADSASISTQKLESTQSCVAKRTIASMEGGVVYASPDGLCLAGPSGVNLLTLGAFEREDWQALNPTEAFGGFHEGVYYLFTSEPGPID